MSRIPLLVQTPDIVGAFQEGRALGEERRDRRRLEGVLSRVYGDQDAGLLAMYAPEALDFKRRQDMRSGMRNYYENTEAGISPELRAANPEWAAQEDARLRGIEENRQADEDRDRLIEQHVRDMSAEDFRLAREMAPMQSEMASQLMQMPIEQRGPAFEEMAAQLIQANPKFKETYERVMADGLLDDNELALVKRTADSLAVMEPTSNMRDFALAQADPEYQAFLDGPEKKTNDIIDYERTLIDPGFKEFLAAGDGPQVNSARAKQAIDAGLVPGTEEFNTYVLNDKPTQSEQATRGYLDRMEAANAEIDSLGDFDPTDALETIRGWSNSTTSAEKQRYNQAASDWIRAKLRKESGAQIAKDEMASEYETYFPVFGDSDEVIAQKGRARKVAEQQMRAMLKGGSQQNASPGMPKVGEMVDGYEFLGGDPANESSWKKR